jgi:general secretion pathway protein G
VIPRTLLLVGSLALLLPCTAAAQDPRPTPPGERDPEEGSADLGRVVWEQEFNVLVIDADSGERGRLEGRIAEHEAGQTIDLRYSYERAGEDQAGPRLRVTLRPARLAREELERLLYDPPSNPSRWLAEAINGSSRRQPSLEDDARRLLEDLRRSLDIDPDNMLDEGLNRLRRAVEDLDPMRPRLQEAQRARVAADMQQLSRAIDLFKLDTGRWPQQLNELWERPANEPRWGPEPYLSDYPPLDPWGQEYVYDYAGGRDFELISYGADQAPGGVDQDSDLSSRTLLDGR